MSEEIYVAYRTNKRYYYMIATYDYSLSTIREDLQTSNKLDLELLYLIARQKNDAKTMEKLMKIDANQVKEPETASLTLTKEYGARISAR